ncbi:MAG TPA: hypothetical protein VM489_00680, partial [Burkholderiales bacterium]|nr:hypothetical protein [Burkholderiales bacterium]
LHGDPSHSQPHLLRIRLNAAARHPGQDALIALLPRWLNLGFAPGADAVQGLPRPPAVRLPELGRINIHQTNADLSTVEQEHGEGVAVVNAYDATGGLGVRDGARGSEQRYE